MPAKPTFTEDQYEVIFETARRVFQKDFAWMKKATKDHPAAQEAFGLAIGVSQQSASALLKGKYKPGLRIASNIANLDGKTLRQLIGDFDDGDEVDQAQHHGGAKPPFLGLDACLTYHAGTKIWSPWTVAAARAGFFGNTDFPAPAWEAKLDRLEKALERVRKAD